jgi:hypothetical protein
MCVGFGQGASVIWENPHYAEHAVASTSTNGAQQ